MAIQRSRKLRLHIFGSKVHKWLTVGRRSFSFLNADWHEIQQHVDESNHRRRRQGYHSIDQPVRRWLDRWTFSKSIELRRAFTRRECRRSQDYGTHGGLRNGPFELHAVLIAICPHDAGTERVCFRQLKLDFVANIEMGR